MAVWLAEQVGPNGHVVATDLDTRYLNRRDIPNLEVVEHNILDDPLDPIGGSGSFDLVCSRLMLFHLRDHQEAAVRRMVECLRPGGWLMDEDADWGTIGPADPLHPAFANYDQVWRGGDWWTVRGYDPVFGRKLPVLFEHCGLEDISHEASTEVVRGGSRWAEWISESLDVIYTQGGGSKTESETMEHEAFLLTFADPSVWLLRELLHCCRGRRPGG
jgi:SAM-dependent methyltransferase